MFVFLLILALIFLIGGGVGLFYTNINLAAGSHYWMHGNITYGTFTMVGIVTLVFMILLGSEIE